jgi:ribosome-binding protein aMBF1 (putative translation factor)
MAKLGPPNDKLFEEMLKDIPAFLAGRMPKSFIKVDISKYVVKADVKAARKATKLSQAKFAEALGLSTVTLQAWEAGRRHPRGLESKVIRAILKEPKFVTLLAQM